MFILGFQAVFAVALICGCDGRPNTPAENAFNACVQSKADEADDSGRTISPSELERACRASYWEAANADTNPPTENEMAFWGNTLHYKVLELHRRPHSNCGVDLQIPKKMETQELRHIAESVKQNECRDMPIMILGFYLPGMKAGEGAWANAQYDPEISGPAIKVQVTGVTVKGADEELQSIKLGSREELIGSWTDNAQGVIVVFKKNGRLYRQLGPKPVAFLRDGLQVSDSAAGKKLKIMSSETGDYYVMTSDGNLQLYDREGFIRTAEKSQR